MANTIAYPPACPFYPPAKRAKMTVHSIYYLAHKARAKLASEAARPDHDLRLLVGHANLLDSLMLDLADAERQQEAQFNQAIRQPAPQPVMVPPKPSYAPPAPVEEDEPEWDTKEAAASSSDEDDSEDVEMAEADIVSLRRVPSRATYQPLGVVSGPTLDEEAIEDYDEDEDEEEEYAQLSLRRTRSGQNYQAQTSPPPELDEDEDDSAEDEPMPPSPPQPALPTFAPVNGKKEEEHAGQLYRQDYYIPQRNPERLVNRTISVY